MSAYWIRVTKDHPCPICCKPDWCLVGERFVLCNRIESDKRCAGGGWLHARGDATKLRPLPPKPERPVIINAARIMDSWAGGTWPEMVEQFAGSLGVTVRSLEMLGAAWSPGHRAWAVPMKDWKGNTVGIRLRLQNGSKRAVKGSHNGLFYAEGQAKTVFVVEGESDCAAGLSIGLCCVGRPGCMGNEEAVDRLLHRKGARQAILIADNDDPGQRGAEKLQAALSVPSVIFVPPAKDLREFVRLGGTKELIESMTRSLIWTQPKKTNESHGQLSHATHGQSL